MKTNAAPCINSTNISTQPILPEEAADEAGEGRLEEKPPDKPH